MRIAAKVSLAAGLLLLTAMVVGLRFAAVNDRLGRAILRDPERTPPQGDVLVAPADGHILYVRRFEGGVLPEVVKKGVPVPVTEHLKTGGGPDSGWLVGIYMNTHGVHVNRVPDGGRLVRQTIFNGPHMNMTSAELRIVLGQLVPGRVTLRKLLGKDPYAIEGEADFVLKSARETLEFEDARGKAVFVVRIADFYVGKILTWVGEGDEVSRGQRLGMITWGSQTDILFEDSPGLRVAVRPGQYVYAGETILASY